MRKTHEEKQEEGRLKAIFKTKPTYTISAHPHKEEKKKNADIEEGKKYHQQQKKEAKAQNETQTKSDYSSCSNCLLLLCLI